MSLPLNTDTQSSSQHSSSSPSKNKIEDWISECTSIESKISFCLMDLPGGSTTSSYSNSSISASPIVTRSSPESCASTIEDIQKDVEECRNLAADCRKAADTCLNSEELIAFKKVSFT